MKKIIFLFFIFLTTFLFSNNIYINNYPFEDEFAQIGSIKQILQDQNDFIWFIDEYNLYKYNGEDVVKKFENKDKIKLNYFFQDFSSNFWLATNFGLLHYNERYESYSLYPLKNNEIYNITQNKENTLLLSTQKGLITFDKTSQSYQSVSEKLESYSINKMGIIDSIYFLATDKGLLEYNPSDDSYLKFMGGQEIKNLIFTYDTLWFYTDDSLFSMNLSTKNIVKQEEDIEINDFLIYEDFLWIAHSNGLKRAKLYDFELEEFDIGFPVNYLFKDNGDFLWFSNDKYNLSRINVNSRFETFLFDNSSFESMVVDEDGFIWIANGKDLKVYNSFAETWEDIFIGLDKDILSIKNNNDKILLLTDKEIYIFNKKDYSTTKVLKTEKVITDVFIDTNQNYFITLNDGLYKLENELLLIKNVDNIISLIGHENKIWGMTTEDELIEYDIKNELFEIVNDTPISFFNDLAYSNKIVYISDDYGITSYNTETKEFSTIISDFPVSEVQADRYGNIWFSTKHSIYRFFPLEKRYIEYDFDEGVYINNFSKDSYITKTNEAFFLTENSLTSFYIEDINPNVLFHPLVIEKIESNGTIYKYNEDEKYNFKKGNVEISFDYADYKNDVLVRYRFENDGEWNYIDEKSIKLPNIQQGDYNLKIQTIDKTKKWVGGEKNIKFSISYNIFTTNYAIFFYIILSLLFILSLVYFLMIRIRGKFENKTKQLIRQHIEESQENSNYLEKLNKKIEKLSFYDPLTGIQNLRLFEEIIEREWNLAKRKKYPLSIIIIDIDNFKNYNDEYGHLKGDEVIVKVSNALKSCLRRSTDHIFRYAGEKFAAVLPDTDKPGANVVANNMKSSIEKLKIEHKKSEVADHITVSIGTSTEIPTNIMEIDAFINEAEEALLKAKNIGKNRIIQHNDLNKNDS